MQHIAILEGYKMPRHSRRRRSSRKGGSQRMRFKRAAKACKGKGLRAFRACMRQKLRK